MYDELCTLSDELECEDKYVQMNEFDDNKKIEREFKKRKEEIVVCL